MATGTTLSIHLWRVSEVVTLLYGQLLSADVKGYSRLMGNDEEATIRTLTAYREVMTTLIQQHRGRVVDSPGDNLLAEFAKSDHRRLAQRHTDWYIKGCDSA